MRFASGADWLALGVAAVMAMTLLFMLSGPFGLPLRMPLWVLYCLCGIPSLIGVWKLTAPDPGAPLKEQARSTRNILRALVVAAVASQAWTEFAASLGGEFHRAFALLRGGIWIAGFVALFRYARQLARRLPDGKLASETTFVMWGTIISYCLLAGMAWLMIVPHQLPDWVKLTFALSCTVALGCVVFPLLAISLLLSYRRALRDAATEARATWAKES